LVARGVVDGQQRRAVDRALARSQEASEPTSGGEGREHGDGVPHARRRGRRGARVIRARWTAAALQVIGRVAQPRNRRRGGGCSCSLPQLSSHSTTLSCGIVSAPASDLASVSSIAATCHSCSARYLAIASWPRNDTLR